MPTTLSIWATDSVSVSRAFQWPVLESGNGSFENGIYSVVCEDRERGKSFFLEHKVQGSPLIDSWTQAGNLIFVCTVAAPRSMYRELHQTHEHRQFIEWEQENLGECPMFTPMIVARRGIHHVADSNVDGLSRIWDGKKLLLPRGARVAVGPTFKFQSGITGLLDFSPDESLESGRFRIEPSSENGFTFKVYLARNLYNHLRYNRGEPAGTNIMVHIVSAALARLRQDYSKDDGEEGWRSFPNLVVLSDILRQQGLPHWADEEFRPEVVATGLHPHKLPIEGVAQDGQE